MPWARSHHPRAKLSLLGLSKADRKPPRARFFPAAVHALLLSVSAAPAALRTPLLLLTGTLLLLVLLSTFPSYVSHRHALAAAADQHAVAVAVAFLSCVFHRHAFAAAAAALMKAFSGPLGLTVADLDGSTHQLRAAHSNSPEGVQGGSRQHAGGVRTENSYSSHCLVST